MCTVVCVVCNMCVWCDPYRPSVRRRVRRRVAVRSYQSMTACWWNVEGVCWVHWQELWGDKSSCLIYLT